MFSLGYGNIDVTLNCTYLIQNHYGKIEINFESTRYTDRHMNEWIN